MSRPHRPPQGVVQLVRSMEPFVRRIVAGGGVLLAGLWTYVFGTGQVELLAVGGVLAIGGAVGIASGIRMAIDW